MSEYPELTGPSERHTYYGEFKYVPDDGTWQVRWVVQNGIDDEGWVERTKFSASSNVVVEARKKPKPKTRVTITFDVAPDATETKKGLDGFAIVSRTIQSQFNVYNRSRPKVTPAPEVEAGSITIAVPRDVAERAANLGYGKTDVDLLIERLRHAMHEQWDREDLAEEV